MDALFSCRNCIHNCAQTLVIGRGPGFCIKHDSVLTVPERTTCKYLHRKDLPQFVVNEGVGEHAAEFAAHSGMVDLLTHESIGFVRFRRFFADKLNDIDSLTEALSRYRDVKPRSIFLQAMAGGVDGRRMLAHAALARRYLAHFNSWKSAHKIALTIIRELSTEPQFELHDLVADSETSFETLLSDARWDVFYVRLAFIQEYGFHAGIEELMWATDQLGDALSSLDYSGALKAAADKCATWTELVHEHQFANWFGNEMNDVPTPKLAPAES